MRQEQGETTKGAQTGWHAGNSSRIIPESLEAMGIANKDSETPPAEKAHTIVVVNENNTENGGSGKSWTSATNSADSDEHRAAPLPWLGLRSSYPPIPVDTVDDDCALFGKESTLNGATDKSVPLEISEDEKEDPQATDSENKRLTEAQSRTRVASADFCAKQHWAWTLPETRHFTGLRRGALRLSSRACSDSVRIRSF